MSDVWRLFFCCVLCAGLCAAEARGWSIADEAAFRKRCAAVPVFSQSANEFANQVERAIAGDEAARAAIGQRLADMYHNGLGLGDEPANIRGWHMLANAPDAALARQGTAALDALYSSAALSGDAGRQVVPLWGQSLAQVLAREGSAGQLIRGLDMYLGEDPHPGPPEPLHAIQAASSYRPSGAIASLARRDENLQGNWYWRQPAHAGRPPVVYGLSLTTRWSMCSANVTRPPRGSDSWPILPLLLTFPGASQTCSMAVGSVPLDGAPAKLRGEQCAQLGSMALWLRPCHDPGGKVGSVYLAVPSDSGLAAMDDWWLFRQPGIWIALRPINLQPYAALPPSSSLPGMRLLACQIKDPTQAYAGLAVMIGDAASFKNIMNFREELVSHAFVQASGDNEFTLRIGSDSLRISSGDADDFPLLGASSNELDALHPELQYEEAQRYVNVPWPTEEQAISMAMPSPAVVRLLGSSSGGGSLLVSAGRSTTAVTVRGTGIVEVGP